MQHRELKEFAAARGFEIVATYEDIKSGATTNRQALKQMVMDAKEKKFDVVLVYKFDRIARSLRDLLNLFTELEGYGVKVISVKDNIDMTTSAGRLMFNLIGAFSEFERSIIRERVISGLKNAKARGQQLGRPARISKAQVMELTAKGMRPSVIAKQIGASVSSVYDILAKAKAVS